MNGVVPRVLFGVKYKCRFQRRRSPSMYILRSAPSRIASSTLRHWFISGCSLPGALFPGAPSDVLVLLMRVVAMIGSFTHPESRQYNVWPRAAFPGVAMTGASGPGVSISGPASMAFPVPSVFCHGDFSGRLTAG